MRWSAVALGVIAASCSSAKLDRVTAGPPRLISPMSGSYITSPDPTLTFELPPGFDHGTIELCTDRDCKNVFETIPATGNTVQAHSSVISKTRIDGGSFLSNSFFWHLKVGGGTSPIWMFRSLARTDKVDTFLGTASDFNADGIDDLAMTDPQNNTVHVQQFNVAFGKRQCDVTLQPEVQIVGPPSIFNFGRAIAVAGDVNGDGFIDLVVSSDSGSASGNQLFVLHGQAGAIPLGPPVLVKSVGNVLGLGATVTGPGDIDGDGYADVVASVPGGVLVVWGSKDGLSQTTRITSDDPQFGCALSGAGDLDGDRLADFAVSANCDKEGDVYVVFGSRDRQLVLQKVEHPPSTPGFGAVLAFAGDNDEDGRSDLFVGTHVEDLALLYSGVKRQLEILAPLDAAEKIPGFGAAASVAQIIYSVSDEPPPTDSIVLGVSTIARGNATKPGGLYHFDDRVLYYTPEENPLAELLDISNDNWLFRTRENGRDFIRRADCEVVGDQRTIIFPEYLSGAELHFAK